MLGRSLLLGSSIWGLFASSTHFAQAIAVDTSIQRASLQSSSDTSSISQLPQRDLNPSQNAFITPPPFGKPNDFSNDTVYTIGSQIIEVEWISEWQSVDLQLCQPSTGPSYGCVGLIRGTLSKGFHWPVANLTENMIGNDAPLIPNVYYFLLAQANVLNPNIMSHYFSLSQGPNGTNGEDLGSNGTDSNTNPASNSTGAANGSDNTTATNSPTGSGTSGSAPGPNSPTGFSSLSTPGQVAIYVVSAAIGAGLCGAGIFWLVLRHRRERRVAKLAKITITESASTLSSPVPLQEMHSETYVHETGKALPHEILSKEVPMELPAEVPGLAISRYDDDEEWEEVGREEEARRWSDDNHAQPRDGGG